VHHYGTVDRVYLEKYDLASGMRICKVRFRKMRRPELGDKTCSRHGQKGVMGMIVPAEDMPFSKNGIVPDLIINPHAFPSRMTIGHLVECIFAKLCCMEGMLGDGTVFLPFDIENVATALEKHNFERYGNEILYNGRTGEQIATEILIAPTFYLRLKHMVADKVHSRSTGPRDQLTRQPTSGRSKAGGLRIGEMERDVLLSYGFSQFSKESLMERSDKHRYHVCRHCGTSAVTNRHKNYAYCTDCGGNNITAVETPYAFKLLIQELEAMGIQVRLSTETPLRDPMEYVENNDDDNEETDAPMPSIEEEDADFEMDGGAEQDSRCGEGQDRPGLPESEGCLGGDDFIGFGGDEGVGGEGEDEDDEGEDVGGEGEDEDDEGEDDSESGDGFEDLDETDEGEGEGEGKGEGEDEDDEGKGDASSTGGATSEPNEVKTIYY
jgi:hypothetical protein